MTQQELEKYLWGAANLSSEGDIQTAYLKTIKTADKGDCNFLLTFARSLCR